jgi:hypothetical protein
MRRHERQLHAERQTKAVACDSASVNGVAVRVLNRARADEGVPEVEVAYYINQQSDEAEAPFLKNDRLLESPGSRCGFASSR